MYDVTAVVIAYDWPSNNGGGRIAIQSALNQLLRIYSEVCFIGLVDRPFDNKEQWKNNRVVWAHIPTARHAPWRRFLRSLISFHPAITMQFHSRKITRQVLQILSKHCQNNRKNVIIFEDVQVACLLPQIKQQFSNIPIAIRSENCTVKAFEGFCHRGNWLNRLAWHMEVVKIARFEKQVCQIADRVWAITDVDMRAYKENLSVQCDGLFGVSLDIERYSAIPLGDPFTILYIGSTDLRKSRSLWRFINESWKQVRFAFPNARFLLAGNDTEQFTREHDGVIGLGYCEDEREFLSRGAILLNPQEDGAGIKLKSIVAMLSGKVLVSTEIGVEGIKGQPGKHFLVAKNTKELGDLMVGLMKDQVRMMEISRVARSFASDIYTDECLWQSVKPLLEDLADLS